MQEFSSLQYLMIDIANNFGLDKLSWDERIQWTKDNICCKADIQKHMSKADSPAQFYAGANEYIKYLENPEYESGYGISLDATSSGSQWLSVLTGDEISAKLCNVLNVGTRMDCYTAIYKKFEQIVGKNPTITRDKVKKAIMTINYGSKATPKELFGEENMDIFEDLMSKEMPLAWELNNILVDMWMADVINYGWVMPDNFHVNIDVKKKIKHQFNFRGTTYEVIQEIVSENPYGRAYSANTAHSLDSLAAREIVALAMYNPEQIVKIKSLLNQKKKKTSLSLNDNKLVLTLVQLYKASGFLSARILDHINEDNIAIVPEEPLKELLDNIPEEPFEVICIHDSFRVLPKYGNDIRRLYILQLAKVARSNMLSFILSQLFKTEIKINKGNLDWKEVLQSEYALS